MTPLERADKVRDWIYEEGVSDLLDEVTNDPLLPPGSLILTPDEATEIRDTLRWILGCYPGDGSKETNEALALLSGKGQT